MNALSIEGSKRLLTVAVLLVVAPALLEALVLDPKTVWELGPPSAAMPHLVLSACIPYLAVALSCAALALLGSYHPGLLRPPKRSVVLLLLGGLLAIWVAIHRGSVDEALLGTDYHAVQDNTLQMGHGGPFAFRTPIEPVALDDDSPLTSILVPQEYHSQRVTARWYAHRTVDSEHFTPVELIASGNRHDVTPLFASLRPGETRLVSHDFFLSKDAPRIELRLATGNVKPVVFFDAKVRADFSGFVADSGGGNLAYATDPSIASRLVSATPPFTIEGEQVVGGYTVLVFSGLAWTRHDLRTLLAKGGHLHLLVHGSPDAAPPWVVRLVAQGTQTADIPLAAFRREPAGAHQTLYTYPLEQIDWQQVAPGAVVGLALHHHGAAGPFRLQLEKAWAGRLSHAQSGFALLAVSGLSRGSPPARPLLTAGPVRPKALFAHHGPMLRLMAALLLLLGGLGVMPLVKGIWRAPFTTITGLMAGPATVLLLEHALPILIAPRPEHLSLALVGLTLGGASLARYRFVVGATDSAPAAPALEPSRGERLLAMDALKTVAMVGIIGIHVTADPTGAPYASFPPGDRLIPALGRALVMPFDIGVFVAASLFLLSHSLARHERSYGEVAGRRLRRLLVPFVAWSLLFLVFRYAKAFAFDYTDAYRLELSELSSWLRYAVLGSAQYHLHFLPLLAGVTLLYPAYREAQRKPALALLFPITIVAWFFLDRALYAHNMLPETRLYLLHATKILGYLGFGFLAFGLHGLLRNGPSTRTRRVLLASAVLVIFAAYPVLLQHAATEARTGRWLTHGLDGHMARHFIMASPFVLFALVEKVHWPQWLVALSPLTFGVYLVHPFVLDVLEIIQRKVDWSATTRTAVNFVAVVILSFVIVSLLAKIRALCWLLGLGEAKP